MSNYELSELYLKAEGDLYYDSKPELKGMLWCSARIEQSINSLNSRLGWLLFIGVWILVLELSR